MVAPIFSLSFPSELRPSPEEVDFVAGLVRRMSPTENLNWAACRWEVELQLWAMRSCDGVEAEAAPDRCEPAGRANWSAWWPWPAVDTAGLA